MAITVLSADEYKAQEFDAVLLRDEAVVCVRTDGDDGEDREELVRLIPLGGVNHVDADPDTMLHGAEVPDWFYGGGTCGFVHLDKFPELRQHLDELERETV